MMEKEANAKRLESGFPESEEAERSRWGRDGQTFTSSDEFTVREALSQFGLEAFLMESIIQSCSDESLDMLETMTRSTGAALICLRGRVNIPGPLLLCL
ncbi:hypothetical protein F2P79_013918 [Pimephales promelas]|nr:hypothetical protein F2P79_013918 [Pimephales promelas]